MGVDDGLGTGEIVGGLSLATQPVVETQGKEVKFDPETLLQMDGM